MTNAPTHEEAQWGPWEEAISWSAHGLRSLAGASFLDFSLNSVFSLLLSAFPLSTTGNGHLSSIVSGGIRGRLGNEQASSSGTGFAHPSVQMRSCVAVL